MEKFSANRCRLLGSVGTMEMQGSSDKDVLDECDHEKGGGVHSRMIESRMARRALEQRRRTRRAKRRRKGQSGDLSFKTFAGAPHAFIALLPLLLITSRPSFTSNHSIPLPFTCYTAPFRPRHRKRWHNFSIRLQPHNAYGSTLNCTPCMLQIYNYNFSWTGETMVIGACAEADLAVPSKSCDFPSSSLVLFLTLSSKVSVDRSSIPLAKRLAPMPFMETASLRTAETSSIPPNFQLQMLLIYTIAMTRIPQTTRCMRLLL